jgi:hypothetical protein
VCFPLDIPMVHSSTLVIATGGEQLTCDGFSLDETVRIGSLEIITDYFGGPNLSPKGSDPGVAFMGTTCSRSPPLRAMIQDSTEEFYKASRGEGGSGLPSSPRHSMGALLAPVTTTPWLEDILATSALTTVPARVLAPRSGTDHPTE